ALGIVRRIVANLNRPKRTALAVQPPRAPHYDPAELGGVIPRKAGVQYDVREVIARLVDGSE
ncbi:MAG TPA: methylcrotonoyl-CoA carboxylase, partial [Alphaproteobacteria bacterium]|nr:methylcrotonoyl-CoA carboxylase [Alphaproteobacteria bacterium]